jgi:uncharacterized protein
MFPQSTRPPVKTVILQVMAGSRSFGLATERSDQDLRGVFLAPPREFFALDGAPRHVDLKESEEFYWELGRFCSLALRANPNLLECLHSEKILVVTDLGQELLDLRDAFLSKKVYATYLGYAQAQFRKMRNRRAAGKAIKWKHAMHLCRLLISGRKLLASGVLQVDVGAHRDPLLAIKNGEMAWDEFDAWRVSLEVKMEEASRCTSLPRSPDLARVEDFLIRARTRSLRS